MVQDRVLEVAEMISEAQEVIKISVVAEKVEEIAKKNSVNLLLLIDQKDQEDQLELELENLHLILKAEKRNLKRAL